MAKFNDIIYGIFYYPNLILSRSVDRTLVHIYDKIFESYKSNACKYIFDILCLQTLTGIPIALSDLAYKYSSYTILDVTTPFTPVGFVPLLLSAGVHGLFSELMTEKVERLPECPVSTVLTSMISGLAANYVFNKATYSLAPFVATAIASTLGCSAYTKSAQFITGAITLIGVCFSKEAIGELVYERCK